MKVTKVVKAWRYPEASERKFIRSIQGFAKDITERLYSQTKALKFDASDDEIDDSESDTEEYIAALIAALLLTIPSIALTIYKFNSKQWISVAKSSGGAKNPSVIILDTLGANASESWYTTKESSWETIVRAMLSKLGNDILSDWSSKVRMANVMNKRQAEVENTVQERFSVYKSWAVNRASGSVQTWNTMLMRQRLDDAGVTSYIWRGMLDERERVSHLKLEKKVISLNDRDHIFPGEEYGCRCWAQPDWG